MQRRLTGPTPMTDHDEDDDRYDLDELLHPANAFTHPSEVVNDPDLTLSEKRAILASWASDACAVEAAPALRRPPGNRAMQARPLGASRPRAPPKRTASRARVFRRREFPESSRGLQ